MIKALASKLQGDYG